ncbi:hypothetical protein DYB32_004528 [Aphanomyces invadans]|uniref:Amino acid transporter transmembrane domain-containing protein n=1 Tax=Aphanomyces invadans TaxID=157072 RepID=A0A3R6VY02_9STRA|nr:hypothetical protein DYB32_004528 [Aphanomyces invadans]
MVKKHGSAYGQSQATTGSTALQARLRQAEVAFPMYQQVLTMLVLVEQDALATALKTIAVQQDREKELRKLLEVHSLKEPSDGDGRAVNSLVEAKAQALNNIHTQKVRTLMKSIHQLQEQVATMKAQDKEHRRSALIQNLRKQQRDQELVMEVLKDTLKTKVGEFNNSLDAVNDYILKKTLGGPKRFRPKTREEIELEFVELDKKYKRVLASLKRAKSVAAQDAPAEDATPPADTSSTSAKGHSTSTDHRLGVDVEAMQREIESLRVLVAAKDNNLQAQTADNLALKKRVDELLLYDVSDVAARLRLGRVHDKWVRTKAKYAASKEAIAKLESDAIRLIQAKEQETALREQVEAELACLQDMQAQDAANGSSVHATLQHQIQALKAQEAALLEQMEAQTQKWTDDRLAILAQEAHVASIEAQSKASASQVLDLTAERAFEKQILASKLLARLHKKEKEQLLLQMDKLRTLVSNSAPPTDTSRVIAQAQLKLSTEEPLSKDRTNMARIDDIAMDVPLLLEEVDVDSVELDEHVQPPANQGFVERYITSKVQPGSVKGSMFTMTVSIVGAGVLALPYALEQVRARLGWLSMFVQSVISLNLFGTSVGYLVASSELILLVVKPNGDHPTPSETTQSRNALIGTLCLCFVLPLSLLRSLSSLRFSSLFSLLCIVFLTVTVVVKYFQFVQLGYAKDVVYQWNHLPLFTLDVRRILVALPLVIFAYTCHPNVLPIYLQLQRRSSPRMYKVARRSFSVATTLYVLLSAFVFLTFGMATRTNFLENDYHTDAAVVAGSIFFAVALVITTPLYIHTLRHGLNEVWSVWGPDQDGSAIRHAFVTVALVGSVCGVAILAKDVASVLGILGSTTNPIICFVLPAFFVCKVAPDAYWMEKGAAVLVCFECTDNIYIAVD